ncbi:MAG: GH92 family glycosyl hydrolase [Bacteroidales bacterium]|nr:GH92 family glycosyl hydrolase [Bacteroidales bacterium]
MKYKLLAILTILCCQISAQSPLQYVNPLVGTAPASTESARRHGEGTENKGQTFPAVGRPFGMTQWTPETRTTENKCIAPYYYNDKYITGFRGSHWMSGSCTQDYGSATIMPFVNSRPDTLTKNPISKFSHKNETVSPAYYRITLDDFSTTAELTGSVRSGMMRITFPGKPEGFMLIRMNSDENEGQIWIDKEKNEIVGYNPVHRIYQGWGKPAGFSGWFVIKTDKPFKTVIYLNNNQQLTVSFGSEKIILVKIGTSFTSEEEARKNLEKEIPGWDFEALRKESENIWNQTLSKIIVRGGPEDDKIKFYTALYHCYQLPRVASDADGSYVKFGGDGTILNTGGFDYYDDFSMWDTYRALHPLITIIESERTADMVHSLVLKAQQGGWMPIFPAWANYTSAMIGDHLSVTIADAYLKGIDEFDAETAYFYMRKNAFETPPPEEYKDGKGRRALDSYIKYGYIPLEDSVWDAFHKNEQVSRTLEYAFDDYAVAQFAAKLGQSDDSAILMKRSKNWKNVFDTQTGFVRGRYADGSWIEPFDPYSKAKYICEGTPFQYIWYVPHDVPELIKMMGGSNAFIAKLDKFFEEGHYWHGNEPDHQSPFMFAMAGRPDMTQKWVQKILTEEYGTGPGGLSGNEDAGQMSAWLVFAMMGFYPVCPASNQYVITTPAFDEIRIVVPGKNTFVINSLNRKAGTNYIEAISRNGARYGEWFITHEDITKGNRFTFYLVPNIPLK